jgi:hypothetical protein
MLARLICYFLGHVLEEFYEGPRGPHVYVSLNRCARCGTRIFEVREDDVTPRGLP